MLSVSNTIMAMDRTLDLHLQQQNMYHCISGHHSFDSVGESNYTIQFLEEVQEGDLHT